MCVHCALLNTAIITVLALVFFTLLMLLHVVVHGALILWSRCETAELTDKLAIRINDILEGHLCSVNDLCYVDVFNFF